MNGYRWLLGLVLDTFVFLVIVAIPLLKVTGAFDQEIISIGRGDDDVQLRGLQFLLRVVTFDVSQLFLETRLKSVLSLLLQGDHQAFACATRVNFVDFRRSVFIVFQRLLLQVTANDVPVDVAQLIDSYAGVDLSERWTLFGYDGQRLVGRRMPLLTFQLEVVLEI